PDFQLLCGGFPCQTFSIAGSRKGFGDPRGTLFFELARLAEARKPKRTLCAEVHKVRYVHKSNMYSAS
uniref:DNA cytosine methyltransferase n=1 Tax=Gemmiger formicilis TaxID=745368 RepID=UPI003A4E03CC